MNLEKGNVVRLKSGGPDMTIDNIDLSPLSDHVRCIWFSGHELRSGNFSSASLEIVKPTVTVIKPYFQQIHHIHDEDYLTFPNYDDL